MKRQFPGMSELSFEDNNYVSRVATIYGIISVRKVFGLEIY